MAEVGPRPHPKLTLERIDNDRGYEPGNVRWASWTDQGRNRRTNKLLTYDGKTMCVSRWAEYLGMKQETIRARLRAGWPIQHVLNPQRYRHLATRNQSR